jgi:hypothetical protein
MKVKFSVYYIGFRRIFEKPLNYHCLLKVKKLPFNETLYSTAINTKCHSYLPSSFNSLLFKIIFPVLIFIAIKMAFANSTEVMTFEGVNILNIG